MPAPSRVVAWGLFASWLVHDLEESATMPATSRVLASRLAESSSPVARALGERVVTTHRESAVAIALMGTLVATAAARGARTGGRDRFFQAVLAGLHGHVLTHLGASVALRGYSTGVVTAVTVVLPYSLWARRQLRTRGVLVEGNGPYAEGVAVLVPAVLGVHGAARLLRRR
ncbi:Protein of unknown function with HXXEE motif-containing protein [Rhodococcus triatomae]|uniref:HXXEE domain-containing protein n=1 Tax=Rhodococcus triatomae TaxID=300028 RepID=A0A1G8GKH3_9NOCA|nr:HXXEE domain-containing protein [Rhodococcus triatomae]SDH94894.1 Protein of unknown function with HXXEE motif-containing protein [Rhodococcus triatomae]